MKRFALYVLPVLLGAGAVAAGTIGSNPSPTTAPGIRVSSAGQLRGLASSIDCRGGALCSVSSGTATLSVAATTGSAGAAGALQEADGAGGFASYPGTNCVAGEYFKELTGTGAAVCAVPKANAQGVAGTLQESDGSGNLRARTAASGCTGANDFAYSMDTVGMFSCATPLGGVQGASGVLQVSSGATGHLAAYPGYSCTSGTWANGINAGGVPSCSAPWLSVIENPVADKTFSMSGRLLKFDYNTPVPSGLYAAAFDISGTEMSGDLFAVHGGSTHASTLVDVASTSATTTPMLVTASDVNNGVAIHANGKVESAAGFVGPLTGNASTATFASQAGVWAVTPNGCAAGTGFGTAQNMYGDFTCRKVEPTDLANGFSAPVAEAVSGPSAGATQIVSKIAATGGVDTAFHIFTSQGTMASNDIFADWDNHGTTIAALMGDGTFYPTGGIIGGTATFPMTSYVTATVGVDRAFFKNTANALSATDELECWGNFGTAQSCVMGDGSYTGKAATASALVANGTNCSAGQAPLGVDASGNAEGCFTPTGTAHTLMGSQHSDVDTAATAAGDIVVRNSGNTQWTHQAPGSSTQVLHGGTGVVSYGNVVSADFGAGSLDYSHGGTGNSTAAADSVLVGTGTGWTQRTLPSCSAASSQLKYNNATDTFACSTDASWTSVTTPGCSFSNPGWGFGLAYRKTGANRVCMRGTLRGTMPCASLFTLPTGQRPSTDFYCATFSASGGTPTYVHIAPSTGVVDISGGTCANFCAVDACCFDLD